MVLRSGKTAQRADRGSRPLVDMLAGFLVTGFIFEVRAESVEGKVRGFGARRSRAEGAALLEDRLKTYEGARGWRRWWLEEIDTTGLWQPPPAPAPRERYRTRVRGLSPPGSWTRVHVEVLDGERVVAEYDRNYSMLQTFEPFRQDGRDFELISAHYTATSVLDLQDRDDHRRGEGDA